MPREYDEKRDFKRIDVDCEVAFKIDGADAEELGRVTNLSGRGMMFITEHEIPVETKVVVKIAPENDLTPPLHARVRVVRTCKQRRGDGFEVGAVIQEMLDD